MLSSFKKKNTKFVGPGFYVDERFWVKNVEMYFSLQSWKDKILHSSVYAHVATSGLISAHFKF